ncbi:MAG: lipid droplet-associated protein [Pseudonocardia sp.]|nr:lipid droplet-associated protein [Pseudonocardia sp.]
MKQFPLPVRLAAGIVATAVEQARDLPRQLAELPITAVSQTLQAGMRVQQKVTELAIKGDRALSILQPVEEKPSWATFDDDLDEHFSTDQLDATAGDTAATRDHTGNGFAAVRPRTVTPIDVARETVAPTPEPSGRTGPPVLPEYPSLTIPQLRGRLRFLTLHDLRSILEWENANEARPPFVTMLQNRITTVAESE